MTNEQVPMKVKVMYWSDVVRIEHVMKRLFSERRMDGDEMRDMAQALEASLKSGFDTTDDKLTL